MMALAVKFHLTKSRQIGMCNANVKACPLGGEHYDTREEAATALMEADVAAQTKQEPPAFTPLSKDQAERLLAKREFERYTDEDLQAWLMRDNSAQVQALVEAKAMVDSDEDGALQILLDAGLLKPYTYYSDFFGEDVVLEGRYSLDGDSRRGGLYVGRNFGENKNAIQRSLLHHRRTDRTTLLAASGLTTADVPNAGAAMFMTTIVRSTMEDLQAQRDEEAAAKEAARLAAPIDWQRVSRKRLKEELGDHYDHTNPRHREFVEALEAAGMTEKHYFAPPGYKKNEKWKDHVLRRVRDNQLAGAVTPTSNPSGPSAPTSPADPPATGDSPDRDPRHPYGRRKQKEEDRPSREASAPKELDPQMIEALKLKYLKKFKVPFDESGLSINELLQMAQRGELG